MNKKRYSVEIKADREKIWDVLWKEGTYRDWTSAFSAGSHMVAEDLAQGSKVQFLDPNGAGMYSVVEEHIPGRSLVFKHLGEIRNGEEQPAEKSNWSGAREIYTLTGTDGVNKLDVDIDISGEEATMFDTVFPKALARVKELAEKN